jgi:O-antigen ligase
MHLGAAVLILGLALLQHFTAREDRKDLPNLSVAGSFSLALVALLGLAVAPLYAASEAYLAAGRYLGYAAAALLGWRMGPQGIPLLAWGILGASGVEAWSALSDVTEHRKALSDPYLAQGLMGHKNFTSSAMALGLPAAWYLYSRHRGAGRAVAAAVALLTVLALVLLRTRSIWLGTGIWALWMLATHLKSWKPLAGGLCLGLLVAAALLTQPRIRQDLFDPTNLRIRQVFWAHSRSMIAEEPWTGVGAGQWRIHFPGLGLRGMNPSVAEGVTAEVRPHNDALWVAAEHGIPGIAAWLLLWGGLILAWWRSRKSPLGTFVGGLALIVFCYSMFEFPLERAAVWIPLMLAAGMASPVAAASRASIPRWLPTLLVLTLGGAYAYTANQGLSSELEQQELLALNARQDAANLLPRSIQSLDSWTELDRFGNPSPYFAGMSSMFLEAARGPITPQSFAEAESYFKQALKLHPHHVVTWYQLGNLYRYRGDAPAAERAYRELLKRSPRHPGGQMHLAHALIAQNKPAEAAGVLFAAFGDDAYYQQPDYRNAVVQALRQCPPTVAHRDVNALLPQRDALDDGALFSAFLSAKQAYLN